MELKIADVNATDLWIVSRAGTFLPMPIPRTSPKPSGLRMIRLLGCALLSLAALSGCQNGESVPPLSSAPANQVYRLRVGDVVLLEVFQEPYMTTRQRILGDGTISVGLIGRVAVAGLDINAATKKIAAQLNEKQLVNPQVSISVEAYAPRRFTVWGQVRTPGALVIPGEEELTLPQAIAMAGGNTDIGDIRNVVVTRRGDGGTQKIKLNALSPSSAEFLIQEGDTILVKETLF